MTTIQATMKGGQIIPREPVDWPDGAEVNVTLRDDPDDLFGESPESIARWFALWRSIPSPTLTEEEWATWQERRRKDRKWELANAEARAQALEASGQ